MLKIGLLGGTFDPPHFGHLIMAEEARMVCSLDEVWFLPTFIPPHKNREVTDASHRIEMVTRAIAANPYFRLSLIEYERKGLSYTIDTIEALQSENPETSFYFILGGDMVNDLTNWHRFRDLKEHAQFIGFNRSGHPIHPTQGLRLQFVEMPVIDISSTMIRERKRTQRPIRYYLPESVKNYIEENELYG